MRSKMLGIIAAGALLFGVAGQSQAGVIEYDGTLFVSVGTLPPLTGINTGVATINGSGGGSHINTISFDGGLTAQGTIPLTDPDNATLITLIGDVALPTSGENNDLSGISGGAPIGPDNQMALGGGGFTICLLFANCVGPLPIPITINGTKGAGLGGTFTVNTFADSGFKLSVEAAPWTIGVASIKSVSTARIPPNCQPGPGCQTNQPTYITNSVRTGFAHDPGSGTSSTAAISGRLQLVTPVRIETNLNPPSATLAVWGILTLHTIPEPGLAILLGSGVAGLVLLGRQRMRK
jgi:hypothetical protein